ncbi:PA-phosphatase [Christiangramia fulva]|uniref:PA-phosphatase n=1 Tax=Christiangramia fulva TaxID=2126553 RepID=A0A2R3ZB63_9FLAO|nr:phosphatase PAP2 family protein [Christiangramia fulva]AVR47528.1 PA-phosphatase [Christiangramia fulva]
MKRIISTIVLFLTLTSGFSQKNSSPYKTDFLKDGSIITGELALNALGFYLIQNKDALTQEELNALDKDDLWGINRPAAGNFSHRADKLSYIPFYASFATPLLFLFEKEERENYGQIAVMFIETMATTGALFTNTAGLVEKSRPLVYNENLPLEERTEAGAQRSFFAGHTAATAAATFFTAKICQDFNPDSPAVPYVWAGAVAVPALVGYMRMEAGKHFLTDNIIGFGIGAISGILIPQLHKIGNEKVEVYPAVNTNIRGTGINSQGIGINFVL